MSDHPTAMAQAFKDARTERGRRKSGHVVDQIAMDGLRRAWDIQDGEPIIVVGLLERAASSDGTVLGFGFLRNLTLKDEGRVLPDPSRPGSQRGVDAFVQPSEIDVLDAARKAPVFAMAEIQPSPAEKRAERGDPHACMVIPGTLKLLSRVPDEWSIEIVGHHATAFVLDEALSHIRRAVDVESQALATANDGAKEELSRIRSEIDSLRNASEDERARLAELRTSGERMRAALQRIENHSSKLGDLVRHKGERLVALRLADADDVRSFMGESSAQSSQNPDDRTFDDVGRDHASLPEAIQRRLWNADMVFSRRQIRNMLALLMTNDIIVLAGDSGTGKTSLVRGIVEALGGFCRVVPVRPNWTSPEDLLGYHDPISREYRETAFLKALRDAEANPDRLHVICLDEMNLAKVEQYFADFLSLMEVRGELPEILLHEGHDQHAAMEVALFMAVEAQARHRMGLGDDVPIERLIAEEQFSSLVTALSGLDGRESLMSLHARLRRALVSSMRHPPRMRLPANVRIVGTVNFDDTTHHLSPKVLDRVHVVRMTNPLLRDVEEVEAEIENPGMPQPRIIVHPDHLGRRAAYPSHRRETAAKQVAWLKEITLQRLEPLGMEFGLRSVRQAINYSDYARLVGIDEEEIMDNVVLQKILPKIHLDHARRDQSGRTRLDTLNDLRDDLVRRFGMLDGRGEGHSHDALDRVIKLAEDGGVATFWAK